MFRYVACLSLVMLIGCSKPAEFQRAEVEGTVTLDGESLADGFVAIYPDVKVKGPRVQAKIVGGKFAFSKLDGPAVGANRVAISATKKTGKKISVEGVETDEVVESIPWQYNEATTLTAVVKASPPKNELQFQLKGQTLPREADGSAGNVAP